MTRVFSLPDTSCMNHDTCPTCPASGRDHHHSYCVEKTRRIVFKYLNYAQDINIYTYIKYNLYL